MLQIMLSTKCTDPNSTQVVANKLVYLPSKSIQIVPSGSNRIHDIVENFDTSSCQLVTISVIAYCQQVWQGCDDDQGIWRFRPSKLILKLNRIGSMSECYPLHNWVSLLTLDYRQIPIDIRVFVNVKFPPC